MKANDSLEDRWRKRSGVLVLKTIKQQSAPHTHTHTVKPAINVLAGKGKWEKGGEKLIGLPLAKDSWQTHLLDR